MREWHCLWHLPQVKLVAGLSAWSRVTIPEMTVSPLPVVSGSLQSEREREREGERERERGREREREREREWQGSGDTLTPSFRTMFDVYK